MKYNVFAAIFAILLVVLSVSAQDTTGPTTTTAATTTTPATSPDPIAQCIATNHCAPDDQKCRANCAGVPAPSDSQANATNTCVTACSSSASDPEAYKACQKKCIDDNYFTSTPYTTPGAATTTSAGSSPSASAANTAASTTASSSPSAARSLHGMESIGINLFSILILGICFAAGAWSF